MLMKDLLGNVSFRKSSMRFEQLVIAQSIDLFTDTAAILN